jgi:rhodanese-related sulfurtransferase
MPTGRELIQQAQESMSTTDVQQVHDTLQSGDKLIVLDVREKDEWAAGHIPQATHLPRGFIEGRTEELIPDKSTPIVCH